MSVKLPLQSIFSHLYPAPEPEEPPPAEAEAPAEEGEVAAAEAAPPEESGAEGGEPAEPLAPSPPPPPDKYEVQINTIDGGLKQALARSEEAADHLVTARSLALSEEIKTSQRLDLHHGLEQRKTGLPVGPSHLELDQTVLETHGLLHAKELLIKVQNAQRARSSDVGTGKDILAEEAASRPPPHYMVYTKGFESNIASKGAMIASVKSLRAMAQENRKRELLELEKAGKLPPPRNEEARRQARAKADAAMPMEQQELELKVMKRLQAPLDFLRNQRYVLPPRKAAEDAAPEPPAVPRRDAWIHCNPEKVNFVAYDAGGVYEIPVQLHNTSHLSRRVRVLPPSTRYFSTTLLSYQAEHGTIAPGMHATFHVRFAPDSLADYDDFVVIQTEAESFPLPLHARRSPPNLTLPATLQCGHAFAGGSTHIDFGAQNTGGAGRFFVMEKGAWERGERDVLPTLSTGPFEISPTFLDLQPMDSFTMSVTFRPEVAGPASAQLVLVCDNCQLKELTVAGSGCVVVVNIESVDGQPPLFERGGSAAQESIDFAEVGVFTEQKCLVRLTNSTPLPLQFEWLRYELPPTMLPLTRQRTVAPTPLISTALGEPLSIGDGARGSLDPELLKHVCPFNISPAEGHLPAGEAASFEVTFSPLAPTLFGGAAILRPVGVPEAALPGYAADPADVSDEGDRQLEIGLRLLGRGEGDDLKLWPGALLLHGGSTIGSSVSQTVTLTNPNGSARSYRCLLEGGGDEALGVTLDKPDGEVDAGEAVQVRVTMTGHALGTLKRTLTFAVEPHGRALVLPLEMHVTGPEIAIATPKLDYGLVPLGDETPRKLMLAFTNLTDQDAKWMLCPAPLPRSDPELTATAHTAAEAQAKALNLPFPPPPPAEHGWGWDEHGQSGSRTAFAALQAALSAEHGATGLRPATCCGVVRAHGTTEVAVTIDAAAEQSLRRILELKVEHGRSAHVAVRAEVVARAASLSPPSYALGTTYVRVPVTRTLTLTNLSHIATTFECVHHMLKGRASVTIDPPAGTLLPAQTLKLMLTVTAETAGKLDLLVGCTLHGGTAKPVGCRVSAVVQGLTVGYEAISQDDPRLADMPKTLPPPADEVGEDGLAVVRAPPEVPPLPTIDFGMSVPIFEQRSIVLLVTNLSAVRTRYKLSARKYPAAVLPVELQEPPVPEDYTETATALAHLKQADLKIRKEAEAEARRARLSGGTPWQIEQAVKAAFEKRGLKPPDPNADKKPPGTATSAKSGTSAGGGGGTSGDLGSTMGGNTEAGASTLSATGGGSRKQRPSIPISFHRPILSNAHERLQKFSSESGVTYSAQQQLRKRESALLKEGHGACFEISPQEGILEPWGVVAVRCSVHSCLWGLYDDVLVADVLGLEPVEIPMRAAITGSPILIHDATLGLSNITSPPTLSWAPAPIGSAPQQKTIRVLNRGPAAATLQWSVLRPPDPNRHLAATVESSGGGSSSSSDPLALSLGVAPTDPLTDGSFVVSPLSETIPSGGEKWFQVSFVGAKPDGDDGVDEQGARAFGAMLSAMLKHPAPMPLPGGEHSDTHPPLRLQLKAHSLEPRLQMSERSKLKFKVSPTLPKEHPAYTRSLTMSNASTATLEFTLAIPAPFVLAEARCSSAQFRIMGKETVDEESIFVLPPDSSLQAVITYVPQKRRRRQAGADGGGADGGGTDGEDTRSVVSGAQTATSEGGTPGEDTDPHITHVSKLEKLLQITFASGSVQTFPLLAVTTTPFVELSVPPVFGVPSLSFGVTHISHTPMRSIEMWNPTEAAAQWTIAHLPYKPPPAASAAGARAKAAALAGETLPIDDPTVFEFDRTVGLLPPRAGMTPERVPLNVRFLPKEPGKYRATFTIKVKNGMTAKLEVSATATLREEDIDVVAADKHLRLMQLGEIS